MITALEGTARFFVDGEIFFLNEGETLIMQFMKMGRPVWIFL